jgi:hypothetical protein
VSDGNDCASNIRCISRATVLVCNDTHLVPGFGVRSSEFADFCILSYEPFNRANKGSHGVHGAAEPQPNARPRARMRQGKLLQLEEGCQLACDGLDSGMVWRPRSGLRIFAI